MVDPKPGAAAATTRTSDAQAIQVTRSRSRSLERLGSEEAAALGLTPNPAPSGTQLTSTRVHVSV